MVKIPDWIRNLRLEGYKNIFELLPDNQRLYGTEAFCGDWNAHTMILGKDFAPSIYILDRIAKGINDPNRHRENLETNKNIYNILKQLGVNAPLDGSNSNNCGIIYINAYFLLRDDGKFSGNLPNKKNCTQACLPVFDFVLNNLPRDLKIICMGKDAYEFTCKYFGEKPNWRENLDLGKMIRTTNNIGNYKVYASSHLGKFGINNRLKGKSKQERLDAIKEDWERVFLD